MHNLSLKLEEGTAIPAFPKKKQKKTHDRTNLMDGPINGWLHVAAAVHLQPDRERDRERLGDSKHTG